jgi:hypothetical protein
VFQLAPRVQEAFWAVAAAMTQLFHQLLRMFCQVQHQKRKNSLVKGTAAGIPGCHANQATLQLAPWLGREQGQRLDESALPAHTCQQLHQQAACTLRKGAPP